MRHSDTQTPYIELNSLSKNFGITAALTDVTLDIYAGEVIGLVGSNGAGKSTLMKILTGVIEKSEGNILVEGRSIDKYDAKNAKDLNIACAYQDLSLCTNLKVYENFAILNESHTLFGRPSWRKRSRKETKKLLEKYFPGNQIDVNQPVEKLSLAERQIVEICKTLMTENLKVLILDEPTSALSSDKAKQLHAIVKELSRQGIAVIYISHKLEEIKIVSDRIVLLRNGKNAGECNPDEIETEDLIELLGGKNIRGGRQEKKQTAASEQMNNDILIKIDGYSDNALNNINLIGKKGEIIGISGLVGSGQTELLNVIFNHRNKKHRSDRIYISGSVAYASGDRAGEGIFPLWDIFDNILIGNLDHVRSKVLLDKKKSVDLVEKWYKKLKFKAEGIYTPIMSLSGGNQQKALIARGIASEADIIVLNDPTAGVDIETKQEIYGLLEDAKSEGKCIVFHSTEDEEIEICDRAYILHEGSITEELHREEISVPNIVKASFKTVDDPEKRQPPKNRRTIKNQGIILPLATMLFMILVNACMNPNIISYFGMKTLMGSAIPLVFAALGQMFIVLAGDIDMGNGYSIGLVNVLFAVVMTKSLLWGAVSLVIFIAAYAAMALLIHARSIPSIVVTLGAQFIWLGIALMIAPSPGGTCPEWFLSFYKFPTPFLPMPVWIALIFAFLSWYILYITKYGMILRGIGNNPAAVERSGWSYLLAKATNYGLSAIMVMLSGMTFTAVCLGADANSAASYCMLSIATVILGGCDMSGGKVQPVGVVVGAIAMSFITTLLTTMKIDSNFQTAVTGLILIAVLGIKLITNKGGKRYNEKKIG